MKAELAPPTVRAQKNAEENTRNDLDWLRKIVYSSENSDRTFCRESRMERWACIPAGVLRQIASRSESA